MKKSLISLFINLSIFFIGFFVGNLSSFHNTSDVDDTVVVESVDTDTIVVDETVADSITINEDSTETIIEDNNIIEDDNSTLIHQTIQSHIVYEEIMDVLSDAEENTDTLSYDEITEVLDSVIFALDDSFTDTLLVEEVDTDYNYESEITYEDEIINFSTCEDHYAYGIFIFNDENGSYNRIIPSESKKCKIKNEKDERYIKHQISKITFDDITSYANVDSVSHIIICFKDTISEECADKYYMFNNVMNALNFNIYKLKVKKHCREMFSDILYYGEAPLSTTALNFDVKVITENVIEIILPSDIQSGEYAFSYDTYKEDNGSRHNSHFVFDFTVK